MYFSGYLPAHLAKNEQDFSKQEMKHQNQKMLYNHALWILIFFFSWQSFFSVSHNRNIPIHFAMDKEYETVTQSEEVFSFEGKDSSLTHSISLLSDKEGFPLLFYSDILTPVCIDNICKPMSIEIYWNLLGAYVGYGVFPEEPLTKYDHDLFEKVDYEKLHRLLLDRHSILERRKLSDLFDANAAAKEKVQFKGQEVDAISGATKKEIKESVVEGALYSCYTIWHLVHGQAAQKMAQYLDSIYTPQLAEYFLNTDYEDYQRYALKHFDANTFETYLPRITEVFIDAKPLTRRYILKKLPKNLWEKEATTIQLYQDFANLDINSQTLLINNLEHAHAKAPELLVTEVESMTKNHLRSYLRFLKSNPQLRTDAMRTAFEKIVAAQRYTYAYLIEAFLYEE